MGLLYRDKLDPFTITHVKELYPIKAKWSGRKAYIGVLLTIFILIVASWSVLSVNRTITTSGDDITTFVRNSNGNYWSASDTNIQLAINDLSSGGTVWIPGNTTITITNDIDMADNINLIGEGSSSVLFLGNGADIDMLEITGKENILIEKIRFDGNNVSNAGTLNLIEITGATAKNITIQNCYFINCQAGSMIDCEEGTSYITIADNFFKETEASASHPAGVWLAGQHCIVKNNYFENVYGCGIVMESETGSLPSSWHIIDGNVITGETSHGIHMERNGSQNYLKSNNCTIINNHIYDLYSIAYGVGDYSTGILLSENTTCSNNKIYNVDKNGISVCGNNTIISNNIIDTVWKSNGAGIAVTDKWHYSQLIIEDNIIRNITDQAINVLATQGVEIVKITGNIIESTGDQGILSGGDETYISDNYLENIGTNGIEVLSGAKNVTIDYNRFENIDGGFAIYTTAPSIIHDNDIFEVAGTGIYTTDENNSICTNKIRKCTGDGITLKNCFYSVINDNLIRNCVDGIDTITSYGNNTFDGNSVAFCSGDDYDINGAGNVIGDNMGSQA